MRRKAGIWLIVILVFTIFINLSVDASAIEQSIFFEGEKINNGSNFKEIDDEIYIKARFLAETLDAELRWHSSIQLLEMKKDDIVIKMMVGNPYLQINDSTVDVENGLIVDEGHTYLPFKKVIEGYNYIFSDDGKSDNIYIFKPEIMVNEIAYNEDANNLVIKMSDSSSYQVKRIEDDQSKLMIRIKRATLSGDFRDEVSGDDFELMINRSSEKMYLEMIVDSEKNISFDPENSLAESGNDIIISFLPQLEKIAWNKSGELEISVSGKMGEPEIFYLEDPHRMVVDIPSVMLNDYSPDFSENSWIKDIRISQFKYEPMVLRVVMELNGSNYLEKIENNKRNKLLFQPKGEVRLSQLNYNGSMISFDSNKSVEPKLFTLSDPARLVIDLPGAFRDYDFAESQDFEDGPVEKIRSSRFDSNTVRIVADLKKMSSYQVESERIKDGYRHLIYFNNNIRGIEITDNKSYNIIDIKLSGEVSYDIKKLNSPDRLAVDIRGIEDINKNMKLPEAVGNIKDISFQTYEEDGKTVVRTQFTLDKYYGHLVNSEKKAQNLNIKLWKLKQDREVNEDLTDLIVIDPGHGGFDPGAIGKTGLTEKEVNLDIVLKIKEKLVDKGYNVLLTRRTDNFVSLQKRVEIAKSKKAGLFVSVHNNSTSKSYIGGSEVFIEKKHKKSDMDLAELIHHNLKSKIKLDDRGIRKDNFYVIRNTSMPSVLVEVAFLSNPHEESLLSSDLFLRKAADGISEGIIKYMETQKSEAE